MDKTQSWEDGPQQNFNTQTELSAWGQARRGLGPGLIAGFVIGPCATFVPFLFFGGQAIDSFAFLFVWGLCCLFGLGLGLFNGAVGGAVGGYIGSRFGDLGTARLGGAIGGAIFTGGINVMVIGVMIATNFI